MSALLDLRKRENKTELDLAVLFWGDDQIAICSIGIKEAEIAAQELAALLKIKEAAGWLVAILPVDEIDLAREVWGNTNASITKNSREILAAALDEYERMTK